MHFVPDFESMSNSYLLTVNLTHTKMIHTESCMFDAQIQYVCKLEDRFVPILSLLLFTFPFMSGILLVPFYKITRLTTIVQ